MREVTASRFKAECLGLLDHVAASGEDLLITKRGRPVARVVPAEAAPSLVGSAEMLVTEDELIAPSGEDWDATGD